MEAVNVFQRNGGLKIASCVGIEAPISAARLGSTNGVNPAATTPINLSSSRRLSNLGSTSPPSATGASAFTAKNNPTATTIAPATQPATVSIMAVDQTETAGAVDCCAMRFLLFSCQTSDS